MFSNVNNIIWQHKINIFRVGVSSAVMIYKFKDDIIRADKNEILVNVATISVLASIVYPKRDLIKTSDIRTVLTAFWTVFAASGTWYLVNKQHNDTMQIQKTGIKKDIMNHLMSEMRDLAKRKGELLYGSYHQEYSTKMAYLKRYLLTNSNAESWRFSDMATYKTTVQEWYKQYLNNVSTKGGMKSIVEDELYQVNMARSFVRDSMYHLAVLSSTFDTKKKEYDALANSIDFPISEVKFFEEWEMKDILARYDRFCKYAQPFDSVMGYNENDGAIYKTTEIVKIFKSLDTSMEAELKAIQAKWAELFKNVSNGTE